MGRLTRALRRTLQGLAIATPLLAIGIGVWYQRHYVLPPALMLTRAVPQPNGYDTILAASKLLVKNHNGVSAAPWPKPKTPYTRAQRQAFVAANQAAIAKLREGLAQEYTDQSGLTFQGTPLLALARMLVFASGVAADSGNLAEAATYDLDVIALGHQVPRGGGMMPLMIGSSCETKGQSALWQLVDKLDARTARVVAARLAVLEKTRAPLMETLQEEKRTVRSQFDPIFHKGPLAAWRNTGTYFREVQAVTAPVTKLALGESTSEPEPETLSDKLQEAAFRARIVYYGPRTVQENLSAWMDRVGQHSEQPWTEPHKAITPPGDPLSQILWPVYGQLEEKWMEARAQSRLLQGYLLLRAERLERGRYPDEATALKLLPADPFSPTRAPLRYRRESAEKMTLWSVGPNAVDDGGAQGYPEAGKEGQRGDLVAGQG